MTGYTAFKDVEQQMDVLAKRYDPEEQDETVQTTLGEYGRDDQDTSLWEADQEPYINMLASTTLRWDVCTGEYPEHMKPAQDGGRYKGFLQFEAWEAQKSALDSTERAIREILDVLAK